VELGENIEITAVKIMQLGKAILIHGFLLSSSRHIEAISRECGQVGHKRRKPSPLFAKTLEFQNKLCHGNPLGANRPVQKQILWNNVLVPQLRWYCHKVPDTFG
jgi:hypothetical protein